jgi:hypothetical protein
MNDGIADHHRRNTVGGVIALESSMVEPTRHVALPYGICMGCGHDLRLLRDSSIHSHDFGAVDLSLSRGQPVGANTVRRRFQVATVTFCESIRYIAIERYKEDEMPSDVESDLCLRAIANRARREILWEREVDAVSMKWQLFTIEKPS